MYDDVITELLKWGREIGFREALARCDERKAPRKLRRAAKLIKKMYRGALRISEGKPTEPIAAKHYRR